jgi:LCP family protein required for cell wall assembly
MNRLNTAVNQGNVDLLKQTILYNFGIPIHYFARVDFNGFQQAVDAIDGVDITVSCRLQDWRLKSPELDIEVEENWEQFTLEPGVYHMDGDLALWYARSRLSTNDFDRGRRQQKLLRAMLSQGVDLGLISQVPALWNTFQNSVETDIDIGRLLQFAALAPSIRENGVQNLYIAGKTQPWIVPTNGANVHLPIWEGSGMMEETLRRLFLPPALNKATRPPIYVEIINVSENPDFALLAADNLAWYGFVPVIGTAAPSVESQENPTTHLKYYGPNFKGSYDWLISWIFDSRRSEIELISDDTTYPYHYQVVVGDDYDPCLNQFYAPQLFLDQ